MLARLLDSLHPASTHGNAKVLPWLDGLRGLAILGVLSNHWWEMYARRFSEGFLWRDSDYLFAHGKTGVTLFFIISAFTLFRSFELRRGHERYPKTNFYIRRTLRILPPWWIAVTLYALSLRMPLSEQWCCFTFAFPFFPSKPHVHPGAWSLFVEETFYLFGIFLFPWLTSLSNAVRFFVATYTLRLIWLWSAARFPAVASFTNVGLFPIAHWYVFGLGIIAAHIEKLISVLDRRLVGALALAAAAVFLRRPGNNIWGFDDDFVAFGLFGLVLISARSSTRIQAFLQIKVLRLFGVACYGIYLLHLLPMIHYGVPFALLMEKVGVLGWPPDVFFLLTFPLFCLFNLALGVAFFVAVERPCINLGRRLTGRLERSEHPNQDSLRRAS